MSKQLEEEKRRAELEVTLMKGLRTPGRVSVTIKCGKDIRSREVGRSLDLYCRVSLSSLSVGTSVRSGLRDPEWEQTLWLQVYDPADCIEVDVLDLNTFTGSNFLGQVRVPLTSLPHLQHHSDWYKLEPRPGEDIGFRITGSVQMSLLYTPVVSKQEEGEFAQQVQALVASGSPKSSCACLPVDHSFSGRLYVALLDATGLLDTACSGSANPFAILSIGNCSFRSQTIHNSLTPMWFHEMVFASKSRKKGTETSRWPDSLLSVSVFSEENAGEEPVKMASLSIDFAEFSEESPYDDRYWVLKGPNAQSASEVGGFGKLHLLISSVPLFNPVSGSALCPSGCGCSFPAPFIVHHISSVCPLAPAKCAHSAVGCPHVGSRTSIRSHLQFCPYEALKDNLYSTHAVVSALKAEAQQLRNALEMVKVKSGIMQSDSVRSSGTQSGDLLVCAQDIPGAAGCFCVLADLPGTNYFASANDRECCVRLWETQSYTCYHSFPKQRGTLMSLTCHLEYRGVAMSGGSYPDDTLKLWDSIDIQREQPYKRLADVGEQDSITALCPLPGRRLVTGDENGMIRLWNLDRNTCECVAHAHSLAVSTCATADGAGGGFERVVFSGSPDTLIRIWDAATLQNTYTIDSMVDAVEQLLVLKHMLIAGGKSVIKIFDTRTLAAMTSVDGKAPLTLFQDKLFSSCYEVPDMIKVWDTKTWTCVGALHGHKGPITCLMSRSHEVISSSTDGSIRVWKTV
jgi:F-box/WD-40 domain protein 7